MTKRRPKSPQAGPACHEPSAARSENCADRSGAPRPDPTDYYMARLDELTELGMALARDLVAEAREVIAARRAARVAAEVAAPEKPAVLAPDAAAAPSAERPRPEPGPELTAEEIAANDPAMLAFYRLTRAVRLCMALSMKFHTDRLERNAGPAKSEPAPGRPKRPRRERQLERLVTEAIGREAPEPAEQSRLERLLQERLEDDDIRRDLARCTLGELIQRICADLGIEPDWSMWANDGWARAEIRDKPHGSPYADPDAAWRWQPPANRITRIEYVIIDPKHDEMAESRPPSG